MATPLKAVGKHDAHGAKKVHHEAPHEEEHHEEGGEEPWLVSYADLMTLLFGFFAMLFTYASFEEEEVVKLHKSVAKYFGGTYVAPEQQMAKNIKFEWGKTPYANDLDLKVVDDGLEISFITSVLFGTGNADLIPKAIEPLSVLIELIKASGKEYTIRVEGHTDDNPIGPASRKFPTNWELSAARAATIVRMFEAKGFPPDLLAAVGYGQSRPAYPNKDAKGDKVEANQAHNRRVVIKVIIPKPKNKPVEAPKEAKSGHH